MPYLIQCKGCGHQMSIPENVFSQRIVGKKVSLRCKQCQTAIRIDGTGSLEGIVRHMEDEAPVGRRQPGAVPRPVAPRPRVAPRLGAAPQRPVLPPESRPPASARGRRRPPPPPPTRGARALNGPPSAPRVPPPPPPVKRPVPPLGKKTLLGLPPSPAPDPASPVEEESLVAAEVDITETGRLAATETVDLEAALSSTIPPPSGVEVAPLEPPPPPDELASDIEGPALSGASAYLPQPQARGAFPGAAIAGVSRGGEFTLPGEDDSENESESPASTAAVVRDQAGTSNGSRAPLVVLAAAVVIAAGGAAVFMLRSGDESTTDGALEYPASDATEPAAAEPPAEPPATETDEPAKAEQPAERADEVTHEGAESSEGPGAEAAASALPSYVSEPAVRHLAGVAMRRAERCHPGGHAVGTADVFITFEPSGHVSEARVEGEPIASAPVANCILLHAKSIILPKFDRAPFTLRHPITLR